MFKKSPALGLLVTAIAISLIPGFLFAQTIGPDEVGNAGWGFKFKPPAGWKFQQDNTGAVLGHDVIAGMILIIPHRSESFDQVQQEMMMGLEEEGTVLTLQGNLKRLSENSIAGDYAGIYEWQQVKARGVGTYSQSGGAYIIAISTPEAYSASLADAAEQIAKNMAYFKVDVSDLAGHFAGRWTSVTSHTLTNMTFAPDGSYYDYYESSYGGDSYDQYGNVDMTWGAANQEQSAGRWTVRGTKTSGQIIITKNDGSEIIMNYQVHVEKGYTYWNEYWFNGSLYSKQE